MGQSGGGLDGNCVSRTDLKKCFPLNSSAMNFLVLLIPFPN